MKKYCVTAYEKYRRYLCQYSKSVADIIGSISNTTRLAALVNCTFNVNLPALYLSVVCHLCLLQPEDELITHLMCFKVSFCNSVSYSLLLFSVSCVILYSTASKHVISVYFLTLVVYECRVLVCVTFSHLVD